MHIYFKFVTFQKLNKSYINVYVAVNYINIFLYFLFLVLVTEKTLTTFRQNRTTYNKENK